MTISPDGSDATLRFVVRDDGGAQLTRRDVYDYAAATYPVGDALTDFDGLFVRSYRIERFGQDTHGFAWTLEVEYRSADFGAIDPLPWNDPPEWAFDARTFEREFAKDATTPTPKLVANTAGDLFETLPTTLAVEAELRYTRNEQPSGSRYSLVRDQIIASSDREVYCNTDAFTICRINGASGVSVPAKRCIMWIEGARRLTRNSTAYVEVTYGFRFYPLVAADEIQLLNVGYNALTTANDLSTNAPIMVKGEPIRTPRKLQVDGREDTGTGDPVVLTFKRPVRLTAFAPWAFQ